MQATFPFRTDMNIELTSTFSSSAFLIHYVTGHLKNLKKKRESPPDKNATVKFLNITSGAHRSSKIHLENPYSIGVRGQYSPHTFKMLQNFYILILFT